MAVDWTMLGGGVFSVVTAGIAYKAAVRNYSETTKDSDKSIYVAAVTNERAKWREELRKSVAEFCMLSIESTPNIPKLLQVKTHHHQKSSKIQSFKSPLKAAHNPPLKFVPAFGLHGTAQKRAAP